MDRHAAARVIRAAVAQEGGRPGRRRPTRGWAGAALVCALLASCQAEPRPAPHSDAWHSWRTVATVPSVRPSVPTPTPTPTATPSAAPRSRPALSSDSAVASLDRLLAEAPLHAAVAVLDPTSGQTLVRGEAAHPFVTASIAKVDILASLLLERQDTGASGLTSAQRALATRMIEASDNACATQLFRQAGGGPGLSRANRRFGLTHTHVHDPRWGLTTTTASDQLRLLQQVFTTRSALDASSRAYVQRLMGQVEADQNWGVSAAADGHFALKNGWLPRNDGSWTINSIGGVMRHGRLLLVAVLSDRDASESAGITLTQALAKAAAAAVGGP
ncbi:serine hydrolase [Streptacidiphilus anmyonensis]|uniref:serine hydrolase n=1 Tax=Streptacidiphilus anmyonensis TaxID=405782 RepID=UPI000A01218D|nr:serine hydrolase [Streptacidiphilus anmyonensis]